MKKALFTRGSALDSASAAIVTNLPPGLRTLQDLPRICTNCVENYIDHVFIFKTARAVIDDLMCPELLHEIHVCF